MHRQKRVGSEAVELDAMRTRGVEEHKKAQKVHDKLDQRRAAQRRRPRTGIGKAPRIPFKKTRDRGTDAAGDRSASANTMVTMPKIQMSDFHTASSALKKMLPSCADSAAILPPISSMATTIVATRLSAIR